VDDANSLKISDFDYDLPQELIAQTPIEPRDASRLLVVHRSSGTLEHRHFRDIGVYLRPGDLLVANQSRVLPARLLGHRAETGGAVEVLLLAERPDLGQDHWETLVRPGRRLRAGARIVFGEDSSGNDLASARDRAGAVECRFIEHVPAPTIHDGSKPTVYSRGTHCGRPGGEDEGLAPAMGDPSINRAPSINRGATTLRGQSHQVETILHGEILQRTEAGGRIMRFSLTGPSAFTVRQLIERVGRMPLPPYIHEPLIDPERYQTVYARISGSAAAPTAGLHFTPQLLEQLRQQGIRVGFVTLHVGLDTFRPVECEDVSEHKMHSEAIDLDAPTAELINETRRAGGRIIAVGTTSMRVLESVAGLHQDLIAPFHGHTRLFIVPGYHFRIVDALITNFHLPRSTLLLLVSAFAGKALIEKVYQEAMREQYRFYSFGDAMLLL